jgi:GTP cyclohydrolase II
MEKYYIPAAGRNQHSIKQRIIPVATAELPTASGFFTLQAYQDEETGEEHIALIHGKLDGVRQCPVRVHSQCFTGDVLGSLRCDCREQLLASMEYIQSTPRGLLIYLKQEGRGIGLLNKIRAYHLQDGGADTVDANRKLGLPDDSRDYAAAAAIIEQLGIRSVSLLTNNPLKIAGLKKYGISIVDRVALTTEPNDYNRFYLNTKKEKMGHFFPF